MNIIEKIRIKLNIEHWKVIAFFLCIYDALTVNASYFFAIWLRHDFQYRTIPSYYLSAWAKLIIPYAIITIIIYLLCGIYRSIWRFASYNELIRCVDKHTSNFPRGIVWSNFDCIARLHLFCLLRKMLIQHHSDK